MKNKKVLIIAEAGVNHDGDLKKALKLIDVASDAGADFVKFQTFKTENLVSKKAKKAKYQINNKGDNQFIMLKKLEIPIEWYPKLLNRCFEKKIKFLSTSFDEKSLNFLDSFDMEYIKIPSGEINNKPYLQFISKKRKNIILSTGMSNINEIEDAITLLTSNGLKKEKISVLHCNSEYPTPFKDVNLRAIVYLKEKLGLQVGYSDHTEGIEVPIASVALGAEIIEKHYTLNKFSEGPDHKASLDPIELKAMITSIRNIEKALGVYEKKITNSEKSNINSIRKSIHLKNEIKKGSLISKNDLIMLRPGDGISPMKINEIIGKKVSKNLKEGHKLKISDIS